MKTLFLILIFFLIIGCNNDDIKINKDNKDNHSNLESPYAPGDFCKAVASNNVKKVKNMLKNERVFVDEMNFYDEYHAGKTPLQYASKNGFREIVKLLLEYEASINVEDINGRTPLYEACEGEHIKIAELLLQNKANVEGGKNHVWTPLYLVAATKNIKLAKILLKYGANVHVSDRRFPGKTILHRASRWGQSNMVKLLISKGVKVNAKYLGDTPLLYAVRSNHIEAAKVLIKNGADVNTGTGDNPLHTVCLYGNFEVAKLLLENGADPNIKNSSDRTPLDLAKLKVQNPQNVNKKGRKKIIELLQKYNAK